MRVPLFLTALCLASLAADGRSAAAQDWQVVSDASVVSFVSVKNGETAEAHRFRRVTGRVDERGQARIAIDLASVDTQIAIRDQRMRAFLFKVADFPEAAVRADVALDALKTLAVGERQALTLPVEVAANGSAVRYEAELTITRIAPDRISVATAVPLIVYAEDFGYGAGLRKLQDLAGLDSIQPAVPVTFDLVLALAR